MLHVQILKLAPTVPALLPLWAMKKKTVMPTSKNLLYSKLNSTLEDSFCTVSNIFKYKLLKKFAMHYSNLFSTDSGNSRPTLAALDQGEQE
jgi:hypothetical protein